MRRISNEKTEHVTLRIPEDWVQAFKDMGDSENPWRAIMRDALRQYLRKLGKI